MSKSLTSYTLANKAAWNASAPAHGEGEDWQALLKAAVEPGFSVLDETLTRVLSELNMPGATVVQIGCNNARELLSTAALGMAPKLGIDQSPAFLGLAQKLADAAGTDVRLVEADVYDLPTDLGAYDVALITMGVLNWMPDLPAFFQAVAGLLNDGGRLVIYETHPMLEMLDPNGKDPFALSCSYFDKGPEEVAEMIVYHGPTDKTSGEVGYWFIHTMGEIVTACVTSGLRLDHLHEYPHSNREPEYDLYERREAQMPMWFSLVATRDGTRSA